MRLRALSVLLLAGTASADGYYYEQSFGLSDAREGAHLHLQLGFGYKLGNLSISPWLAGDLTFDRDGAMFDVFGGAPQMGHVDVQAYGADAKYTVPLDGGFSLYARGGPRYASGTDMYGGPGLGVGAGVQLVGRVRALGFLWAPLFFIPRGPMATGALFLDQGLDVYRMTAPGAPAITAPIVSTNIGFAVGTAF